MKKLLATALTALMLAGGAGVAIAGPENGKAGPGHGNNGFGLCTAYFNGQKKGHDGGSPPPFAALEDAADKSQQGNDDGETSFQEVWDYCIANYGIGGNPDNGRFPEGNDE